MTLDPEALDRRETFLRDLIATAAAQAGMAATLAPVLSAALGRLQRAA